MQKSKMSAGLLTVAFVMATASLFAIPNPPTTPDSGTTAGLMTVAIAGLAVARRFIRK